MRKITVYAKNRKAGMSVAEIRDALQGQPGDMVPTVAVSIGGKIREIRMEVEPPTVPDA